MLVDRPRTPTLKEFCKNRLRSFAIRGFLKISFSVRCGLIRRSTNYNIAFITATYCSNYLDTPMPTNFLDQTQWFEEHLQPHEPMLRGWLKSRFPEDCDIDDVLQESFMRVLRAREEGEVRSPKAFLFATARNLAVDIVRRKNFLKAESLVENDSLSVLDEDGGLRENVSRNQELELLTKAIQELPERCRRIFTLRKVYNLSQAEIAKKMGISVNTVSNQLTIGVRKCRDFMQENCDRNF